MNAVKRDSQNSHALRLRCFLPDRMHDLRDWLEERVEGIGELPRVLRRRLEQPEMGAVARR